MSTVLVVGAEPDLVAALEAAKKASRVLFFSFADACALEEELGYRGKTIDTASQNREMERLAGVWATDLTSILNRLAPRCSADYLNVVRRRLLADVFWPVAVARAKARLVREQLEDECELQTIGLTALEELALRSGTTDASSVEGVRDTDADANREKMIHGLQSARAESRRREYLGAELRSTQALLSSGPVVMVLAAVPIHLELLESTMSELQSRGWRCVVVQLHPRSNLSAEAEQRGAVCIPIAPYLPQRESASRYLTGRLTRFRLRRAIRAWADSQELGRYADYLVEGVQTQLREAAGFATAYDLLVRSVRPSAIISVSELYPGVEPVVEVGRRRGVPTIHVQHGNIPEFDRMSDFRFDAFCVFGEVYKETLERLGTARGRLRVVGSPFSERSLPVENEKELSDGSGRPHHLETRPFTILFVAGYVSTRTSHAILYESLVPALEYAQLHPDVRLIVRLHPAVGRGGPIPGYDIALDELAGPNVEIPESSDVYELVRDADCVVTLGSTVAIESARFRKPVILMCPLGVEPFLPLVAEGTAFAARDSADFADCVTRLREGQPIPTEVYEAVECRYGFGANDNVGARIADICEELAPRSDLRSAGAP